MTFELVGSKTTLRTDPLGKCARDDVTWDQLLLLVVELTKTLSPVAPLVAATACSLLDGSTAIAFRLVAPDRKLVVAPDQLAPSSSEVTTSTPSRVRRPA